MDLTISKRGLLLVVVLAVCAVLNVGGTVRIPKLNGYLGKRTSPYRRTSYGGGYKGPVVSRDSSSVYQRPQQGRNRWGREVAADDQDIKNYYAYNSNANTREFRTTCREAVCTNALGYPSERISDAVNLVRRIMTSSHPDMVNKRKEIDAAVLNFHSRPQQKVSNDELEANIDGCSIRANVKRPQEGISTDDERHYLIVNIPSLQQRVQFVDCLGGKSEACEVEGDTTCQQAYREEPLLSLPANLRRRYEARDFKIKKFKIPNGCQCGEVVDLVVNYD